MASLAWGSVKSGVAALVGPAGGAQVEQARGRPLLPLSARRAPGCGRSPPRRLSACLRPGRRTRARWQCPPARGGAANWQAGAWACQKRARGAGVSPTPPQPRPAVDAFASAGGRRPVPSGALCLSTSLTSFPLSSLPSFSSRSHGQRQGRRCEAGHPGVREAGRARCVLKRQRTGMGQLSQSLFFFFHTLPGGPPPPPPRAHRAPPSSLTPTTPTRTRAHPPLSLH